jgi:glutaminyl-peptide cyclotransferase
MGKAYLLVAVLVLIALLFGALAVVLLGTNLPNTSPTPSPTPTQPPINTPSSTVSPTSTSTQTPSPTPTQTPSLGATVYSYSIVQSYPHDPTAFTEGLIVENSTILLESTGSYGSSSLRRVNLSDGAVLQQYDLSSEYFGEGIAVVGDKIVQLTWQNHIGFVYDKATFELLGNFSYNTEGWGLTYDGTRLIMSDGTDKLYFLDPNTYQTTGSINVHDNKGDVLNLNELEYINGTVYANIWHSQKIAVINPQTGQVQAYIDLSSIAQPYQASNFEAVLNGIAYNTQTNQLFVTGKYWTKLYEIKLQVN